MAGALNGRNAVQFNGSQWMASTASDVDTTYTIFTVAAMNTTSGTQRLIGSANENNVIGWWNGSANDLYLSGWVNGAGVGNQTGVDTATHIYSATVNPSGGPTTNFYDLASSLTPLASNSNGDGILGQLEVGGGYNGGSELSNGTVAEVDVFDRVLSPTEIAAMQTYLQAKWMGVGTLSTGALPSGSPLQLASGAYVDLNGTNQAIASLSNYSGSGGTVTNSGSYAATLTLAPASGSTTFSGSIQDGNGGLSLVMSGPGTQVLAGSELNTYSGATTVNGGTLRAGAADALSPNSAVTVNSGTLDVTGGAKRFPRSPWIRAPR